MSSGKSDKRAASCRERRRKRRAQVIEHYGGRCACCGESQYEFLAIDHVHGGGSAHRAEVGGGSKTIEWIIRNGFPDELFQVLCHNCNNAKACHGRCPHEGG